MKKTVSAHVYNTIDRYPQILKTPKVEKSDVRSQMLDGIKS